MTTKAKLKRIINGMRLVPCLATLPRSYGWQNLLILDVGSPTT